MHTRARAYIITLEGLGVGMCTRVLYVCARITILEGLGSITRACLQWRMLLCSPWRVGLRLGESIFLVMRISTRVHTISN